MNGWNTFSFPFGAKGLSTQWAREICEHKATSSGWIAISTSWPSDCICATFHPSSSFRLCWISNTSVHGTGSDHIFTALVRPLQKPIPQQIPLAGQETHERVLALNMGLPPSIASFTWAGVGRHNDLEIWELLVRTSFANKAPSNEKIWLVVSTPLKKYESKWESSPNRDGHKKYLSCHHLEIHLGNFQGCNLFSYITNHQIVPHPRLPVTMSFVCFLWCLVFCGSNNNWELTQIERNQVENIIKQTWKKTRGDDSANWINQTELTKQFITSHTIHVWYIYPHWP